MQETEEKKPIKMWLLFIQLLTLIVIINGLLVAISALFNTKANFTLIFATLSSSYLMARYHTKNGRHIEKNTFLLVLVSVIGVVSTVIVVSMAIGFGGISLVDVKLLLSLAITAIISIFVGSRFFQLGYKVGLNALLVGLSIELEEEKHELKNKKSQEKKKDLSNNDLFKEREAYPKLEEKLLASGVLLNELVSVENIPKEERPEIDGVECNKSFAVTEGFQQIFGVALFDKLTNLLKGIYGVKFIAQEDRDLYYGKSAIARRKLEISVLNKLEDTLKEDVE